jgi:hypothetical protein
MVRCTLICKTGSLFYKYYGAMHLYLQNTIFILQILWCDAPLFAKRHLYSTNTMVRCTILKIHKAADNEKDIYRGAEHRNIHSQS